MHLNGKKVGDHVLSPGLTDYDKRVLYVTFDVTSQLQQGRNAVGVILGNGRYYAMRASVPTAMRTFGYPKLLLQMDIEYDDGSAARIVSDKSWSLTTNGPICATTNTTAKSTMHRRKWKAGTAPGLTTSAWQAAARVVTPARRARRADASSRSASSRRSTPWRSPARGPASRSSTWARTWSAGAGCRLPGRAGAVVSLRFAETLRPDGTLYLDNIRGAKVTDLYTLKGQGVETWEPRFTYHGFRYVEVTGFPGQPTLSSLEGRVLHDDLPAAGRFACSNETLNRIYRAIYWGTRGNYRSIPTDCPQRDERQGWLGDRSEECHGESYLFDVSRLYAKWVKDMHDAQRDSGSISDVVPNYWPLYNDGVTWPSSYIIIPHMLYDQYGDMRTLRIQYAGMKRWIDYMIGFLRDGLMPRNSYGDWCVPPESQTLIHSKDPKRRTDGTLIGTAYFAHDLSLMARSAHLLGKTDDAKRYAALAEDVKKAFNRRFFNAKTGRYDNGTQTSSVLPLRLRAGSRRTEGASLCQPRRQDYDGDARARRHGPDRRSVPDARPLRQRPRRSGIHHRDAEDLSQLGLHDLQGRNDHVGVVERRHGRSGDELRQSRHAHRRSEHLALRIPWRNTVRSQGTGLQENHHQADRRGRSDVGQIVPQLHVRPDRERLEAARPASSRWRWPSLPTRPQPSAFRTADAALVTESGKPAAGAEGVKFLRMESGAALFAVQSGSYQFVAPCQ